VRFPIEIRERNLRRRPLSLFSFVGNGLFIGSLGIEADEALPAGPLYQPSPGITPGTSAMPAFR